MRNIKLQERDQKIIEFLNEFKIAKVTTLQKLFFPSLRAAQMRLIKLHQAKILKRIRDPYSFEYMYFVNRKPVQIEHSLKISDTIAEMSRIVDIAIMQSEYTIENIRADALIGYIYKEKKYVAFLEVELSYNNLKKKIDKYEKLYASEKWKNYFPNFPKLILVTNRKIEKSKNIESIKIKENLSNINALVES